MTGPDGQGGNHSGAGSPVTRSPDGGSECSAGPGSANNPRAQPATETAGMGIPGVRSGHPANPESTDDPAADTNDPRAYADDSRAGTGNPGADRGHSASLDSTSDPGAGADRLRAGDLGTGGGCSPVPGARRAGPGGEPTAAPTAGFAARIHLTIPLMTLPGLAGQVTPLTRSDRPGPGSRSRRCCRRQPADDLVCNGDRRSGPDKLYEQEATTAMAGSSHERRGA
jgi:hypothetical protein